MDVLYNCFLVLVIDYVSPSVGSNGVSIPYFEKGWCWAESNMAKLGGCLGCFSRHVETKLDIEMEEWGGLTELNWEAMLIGHPPISTDLSNQPERREEHMRFRATQQIKSKFFMNGRDDFDVVSSLLKIFDAKRRLRSAISNSNVAEIVGLLSESAVSFGGACSASHLVNEVLDSVLRTSLHFGVERGDVSVVNALGRFGATPSRDINGNLPWEKFALPLFSCSSAARAAKALNRTALASTTLVARSEVLVEEIEVSSWVRAQQELF